MIRKILPVTEQSLRTKSKPVLRVDKKIKDLIKDLKETLKVQKDPEGIGLAASQIGKNFNIFVMKRDNNSVKVVINPQIISETKAVDAKPKVKKDSKKIRKILEGCLSLPNYYGPLVRSPKIKIEFMNEEGISSEEEFNGLEAQIVQHEMDHLNGVLFIDRLFEQKKPLYEFKDGEWEEVEL